MWELVVLGRPNTTTLSGQDSKPLGECPFFPNIWAACGLISRFSEDIRVSWDVGQSH